MATYLPPPPTRADAGDFVWAQWQNSLYRSLASPGAITWATVDKAGSSLADLASRNHSSLNGVSGTGSYHISSAEATNVTNLPTASTIVTTANYATNNIVDTVFKTKSSDPSTTDITSGKWALYKNTTSGLVKLWANDGGTMKSVLLA